MSKFAEDIKEREIERERRVNTNRTAGKVFFDIAKLILAALVLSNFNGFAGGEIRWEIVVLGLFAFVLSFRLGYKFTNKNSVMSGFTILFIGLAVAISGLATYIDHDMNKGAVNGERTKAERSKFLGLF